MITQIEKKVKAYITKKQLLTQGDTIIVGVSGGVDSMMLIDFLYTNKDFYGIHLKVAHINHGMREEAKQDEAYVEQWCQERQIPYFLHTCDVKHLAQIQKKSNEEVGRNERYNFFISLTNPGDKIATAHHVDDQAETILMHFIRGSDIKGLGGIQPKRGAIIRPLLCLTKEEIRAYCQYKKILFFDDHTNFLPIYTRNKMRLECIPYMEKHFNKGIKETLFRQGELYQEANDFIEDYVNKLYERCTNYREDQWHMHIPTLCKEKIYIQKKLIYNLVVQVAEVQKDIGQVHVQSCIELMYLQTGKEIHLPYDIVVKKEYEELIFTKTKQAVVTNYLYNLEIGNNEIDLLNLSIQLTLCNRKTFEQSNENMYTKYVDYDKIKDNLHLRTRKPSDYVTLKGGKKKLKKLFIDEKIPREQRESIPLLVDAEEVIWIIGSRLNSKYFVTARTENILEMKIIKQNAQEGLC